MSRVAQGLRLTLAAGLLFALVGCTGSESEMASEEPTYAIPPASETPTVDVMPTLNGTVAPGQVPTYDVGPPNARIANSLPEFFDQALDMWNLPPEEREIVEQATATGRIDAAVYEAAHEQYVQCMSGYGYDLVFRKTLDGVYRQLTYPQDVDYVVADAMNRCSWGPLPIMSLYETQQSNPDLFADPGQRGFQCLKRHNLIDEDYTVIDFSADLNVGQFPFDKYEDGPNDCLYVAGYAYIR